MPTATKKRKPESSPAIPDAPPSTLGVAQRSVTITYQENAHRPSFVFIGDWTGRDARVASHLLFREYRLRQRDIRRTDPKAILPPPTPEELI